MECSPREIIVLRLARDCRLGQAESRNPDPEPGAGSPEPEARIPDPGSRIPNDAHPCTSEFHDPRPFGLSKRRHSCGSGIAQAEPVRPPLARWLPRQFGGGRQNTMGTISGAITSPPVGMDQTALGPFGPVREQV